jgi:hypothetical protein
MPISRYQIFAIAAGARRISFLCKLKARQARRSNDQAADRLSLQVAPAYYQRGSRG